MYMYVSSFWGVTILTIVAINNAMYVPTIYAYFHVVLYSRYSRIGSHV